MSKPELSNEYREQLIKELEYVNVVLGYLNRKFRYLLNQGMNQNVLQEASNKFIIRKTQLEVEIYAITEYLE
jgi:hypothetical protein